MTLYLAREYACGSGDVGDGELRNRHGACGTGHLEAIHATALKPPINIRTVNKRSSDPAIEIRVASEDILINVSPIPPEFSRCDLWNFLPPATMDEIIPQDILTTAGERAIQSR